MDIIKKEEKLIKTRKSWTGLVVIIMVGTVCEIAYKERSVF